MNNRPVIGIFAGCHDYGRVLPIYGVNTHYLEAVALAGGTPLVLPVMPGAEEDSLARMMACCDGFLLPGGGDFDAEWYGEKTLPNLEPDPTALDMESQKTAIRMVRLAAASGKPVLGVCLGMQALNVALGGSLYQDLPSQKPSHICHSHPVRTREDRWFLVHDVTLEADSLVRRLSGADSFLVNSLHHQAVRELAPGFRATAWAPDGVVEAIESEDGRILGVQWHPENRSAIADERARALFRWLTEKAGAERLRK